MQYAVQYIVGPNERLNVGQRQIIEAASFSEALQRVTNWPVVENYDHSSACARNPGTSLYDFEAWEALPLHNGKNALVPDFPVSSATAQ